MNVFFHTFGCKANQYDTELVRQAFTDRGAVLVDDPAQADLAVINSCTVTHTSEAKMRSYVRRLARGRGLETVVMGCAAALDGGALSSLPSVRAVVGGADPAAVLRASGLAAAPLDTRLRRFTASSRGWLKIQDGCDEHCTFCATTIARGANRSRSIADIVAEAELLAEHHPELVLTGVHIGTYGKDRASSLGELLEALVRSVPNVRFRLSSIELFRRSLATADTANQLQFRTGRAIPLAVFAWDGSNGETGTRMAVSAWYSLALDTPVPARVFVSPVVAALATFGLGVFAVRRAQMGNRSRPSGWGHDYREDQVHGHEAGDGPDRHERRGGVQEQAHDAADRPNGGRERERHARERIRVCEGRPAGDLSRPGRHRVGGAGPE